MNRNRWPLAVTFLGLGLVVGLVASQRLVGQPALPGPGLPAPAKSVRFQRLTPLPYAHEWVMVTGAAKPERSMPSSALS